MKMLTALSCRGPDSAGVAILGEPQEPNLVLRIQLGEVGDLEEKGKQVAEQVGRLVPIHQQEVFSTYLRLVVGAFPDLQELITRVEDSAAGVEVVSVGGRLEVVKQVGSPAHLEESYQVGSLRGTHGIGHTRLSTESRVNLSHSQPFWARRVPDLATVHNGHITNYHKLRRRYEQKGYRFYTENDSEIIGIYLHDQMTQGLCLREALESSLTGFDGSFCYLVANADSFAYVKDRFAFKPLTVAESDTFVAIATEETALRRSLQGDFEVWEPPAQKVQLWSVPAYAAERV